MAEDTCPGCQVFSRRHCGNTTCIWRVCRTSYCTVDHWDPKTGARTSKPKPKEAE